MKDGFLRVATVSPALRVADCRYNLKQILTEIAALPENTALAVFPELSLTGYTCGDLFYQPTLLQAAEQTLIQFMEQTETTDTVLAVGLPVADGAALYNCAAIVQRGKLLGLVPKMHIPSHGKWSEGRYFTPGNPLPRPIRFAGQDTLIGSELIFSCREMPDFRFGVEISGDLFVSTPPSAVLADAGATVIINLAASSESIGKAALRRQLVSTQSARLNGGYIVAGAGEGESSTDLVFSGHSIIAENGTILQESVPFTGGIVYTELDLARLTYDRRRVTTYTPGRPMQTVSFSYPLRELSLSRVFTTSPFVPQNAEARATRSEEILSIQTAGLVKRLKHTHAGTVVGLSGGLDSALALLVIARAYDRLGLSRSGIHAVTMPCFGTTGRTLQNARRLAQAIGATLHEIDISESVHQHLSDIGHDEELLDVTYENAQARERTQVLMDLANRFGALVIGTGDLSELALGWATYNGDHMSMYGVNASVPKTLVRCLVSYEAERIGGDTGDALTDILNTPVSPELLPPKDGVISQQTEQLVGPYDLHDFFLYYLVRYGFPPVKIYRLACAAFEEEFEPAEILKWLKTFIRRFFMQQFKRSCLPDGPRVGSVSFSPRGDWQMPSDAEAALWLEQLDHLS
ncbi:MAG: NAD(+) synthase [Clostridia bacterium]|nr:NAD(+) synthase [Clostridia bacterium]